MSSAGLEGHYELAALTSCLLGCTCAPTHQPLSSHNQQPFLSCPAPPAGRRGGNLSEGSRAAINAFLYRTGKLWQNKQA